MLTGCAIVCLSTIEWDFSWQPNQEVMYRLAAAGNDVLFVETTGARSVRWKDWPRILSRLRSALGRRGTLQRTHPRLRVYSPLVLPFPHARLAHALNTRIIFRAVDRWRNARRGQPLVLWAFLASPMTLALIKYLRPGCVVYHCMGDMTASRPLPAIAASETDLIRRADLIFANSLSLRQALSSQSSRVHLFRAAVDVEAFQEAAVRLAVPADLVRFSPPMAGYVGSIHEWLDLDLLALVAEALPQWQFVMIGPVLRELGRLRDLPNLHWLGQRPHHELPAYIRVFDVCLIPYVLDAYTASAYPGKLNEYLALGKPVVSTPLPEIRAFNEEFGAVVSLAEGAEAFTQAIVASQARSDEARRGQFQEVARRNSWTDVLAKMAGLVEEVLGS